MFRSTTLAFIAVLALSAIAPSVAAPTAFALEPRVSTVRSIRARPPGAQTRVVSRRAFIGLPRHSRVASNPPGRIASAVVGFVKDGPAHTLGSIRRNPRVFAALLAATAAIGGGTHVLGVDPAPIAIGASGLALGVQIKQTIPRVRGLRGAARWRAIAADIVWPTFLAVATAVAGHAAPHPVAPAAHGVTPGSVASASAQTVVIAGDAPAVAITALDSRKHR